MLTVGPTARSTWLQSEDWIRLPDPPSLMTRGAGKSDPSGPRKPRRGRAVGPTGYGIPFHSPLHSPLHSPSTVHGDQMWRWLVAQLPTSRRALVDDTGQRSWAVLSGYLRGIAVIATAGALLIGLCLRAVDDQSA